MNNSYIMEDMAPPSFVCPITREVMTDPVSTCDGHSYERSSIIKWLKRNKISPVTGAVLSTTSLTDNHALRNSIQEWELQQSTRSTERSPMQTNGNVEQCKTGSAEVDMFVLKSNGKVVTKSWLFDNGYTRSDCATVDEFTCQLRNTLLKKKEVTLSSMSDISEAIAHAERSLSELFEHQEHAAKCVDQNMDAIIQNVTVALNSKRSEIHDRIFATVTAERSRLIAQLSRLHVSKTSTTKNLQYYTSALDHDDTQLLSSQKFRDLVIVKNTDVDTTAVGVPIAMYEPLPDISQGILGIFCTDSLLESVRNAARGVIENSGVNAFKCAFQTESSAGDKSTDNNIANTTMKNSKDADIGNTDVINVTGNTSKIAIMVSPAESKTTLSHLAASFLKKYGLSTADTTWKYVYSMYVVVLDDRSQWNMCL